MRPDTSFSRTTKALDMIKRQRLLMLTNLRVALYGKQTGSTNREVADPTSRRAVWSSKWVAPGKPRHGACEAKKPNMALHHISARYLSFTPTKLWGMGRELRLLLRSRKRVTHGAYN